MLAKALLYLSTLHLCRISAQADCNDIRGRAIANGLHYVPGPDTCTLCICENGVPKYCKAVLCSPPQDCRSFRLGNTCCEFICLDDVVKPPEGAEANVRFVAGGAAGGLLLTVALVIYRVRKQKRRRPTHADDQRSLTSIGYISGSMGYMGGTCETALAAWKPPGNYLPRGEAPPPYDEAVAQCRPEVMSRLNNESTFHRTFASTVENMADGSQCAGHSYVNISRPVAQMANPQNCYNAPLLQPAHGGEAREPAPHHPLAPNVVGFPSAIRLTGSLGAISHRGLLSVLQREPDHERPHNVPGFYTTPVHHAAFHRTIPRISTAVDTSILDTAMSGFSRERSLHNEIRRSFHKASDTRQLADTGRSVPRNLNMVSAHDITRNETALDDRDRCNVRAASAGRARAHSEEHNVGADSKPATKPAPAQPDVTLPLTVDKPSCVCSYEGSAPGEDYRSECQNCKSATSSRWVVEEGWQEEEGEGTQTLQRRAPPPAPPPPATATLPQPVTKPSRAVVGQPSNWENWFNTIPDSDTESEEE